MNLFSMFKPPRSPRQSSFMFLNHCWIQPAVFLFVSLCLSLFTIETGLSLSFWRSLHLFSFLLSVLHSVMWQADCLYLFNSAFFVVVDIPQCTLLNYVIFYPIMKFFLLVKSLKFWFKFFWDQVCLFCLFGIFIEFSLYFYGAVVESFSKQVIIWKLFLLFLTSRSRQTLKVREHSVLGPYVDGLSKLAVTSYKVTASFISTAKIHSSKFCCWICDIFLQLKKL